MTTPSPSAGTTPVKTSVETSARGASGTRRRRSRGGDWGDWGSVALAAFLLVLLATLAVMQYHWLGRASEADLQRTSVSLQAAADRFGADFNRELADLLMLLVPGLMRGADEDDVAAAVAHWRERAAWPELVQGIWKLRLAGPDSQGGVDSDPESGVEVAPVEADPGPVPIEVRQLAERLGQPSSLDGSPDRNPFFQHPRVLMAEVPAVLLPERVAFPRRRRAAGGDEARERRRSPRHSSGHGAHHEARHGDGRDRYWLILLDDEVIYDRILPELAQRHFGTDTSLGLRVVDLDGREMWRSDAASILASSQPVAGSELFGPLQPRDRVFGARRPPGPFAPIHDVLAAAAGIHRGQWRLLVLHPSGSLDAAVSHAMHRSLALSLLILLVLAVSVVLLTRGARRARALARRQLEFVAGVTHELKTPLAALRSAGQNLADGVVKPERVRTYGELVDREGRRLEDTVGQILAFAGLENGRELRTRAVDPEQAARDAVADLRPMLDERRVDVELTTSGELPAVAAEPEALGRALRNLLQNAALYGQQTHGQQTHGQQTNGQPIGSGEGRGWVGLDIDSRDGQVRFHVRDRGPGIDPSERRRIFEPFARGRGLAASNVPGSGLGLALVRQVADAHGGSVRLSVEDESTTFTLSIPSTQKLP